VSLHRPAARRGADRRRSAAGATPSSASGIGGGWTSAAVDVLAAVGLLGVGLNAFALLAMPFLRPDVGLVGGAISQYGFGPWAWVQNAGFVALGVGSFALAGAIALAGPASRWDLPAALALAVAGVGCVGLAAFPMDVPSVTTPLGDTHRTAGTIAVGFHLAAMLAFLLAARDDPRWRRLVRPGAALWLVALANALLTQAELSVPDLPIPFGVVMRLVAVPVLAWWAVVAWRLPRLPARGAP
jgi:hypothetical protein